MRRGARSWTRSSAFADRPGRACIALMTLLAVLMAPLLASFHQASVGHVRCEHGDLVELEHDDAPDSASLRARAERRDAAATPWRTLQAASGVALHDHRHCGIASLARHAATPAGSTSIFSSAPWTGSVRRLEEGHSSARDVLVSAPKTSPPGAAVHLPFAS